MLMSASWDGFVRLYDDSDAGEEGVKKGPGWKHEAMIKDHNGQSKVQLCPVTYIDFKRDE